MVSKDELNKPLRELVHNVDHEKLELLVLADLENIKVGLRSLEISPHLKNACVIALRLKDLSAVVQDAQWRSRLKGLYFSALELYQKADRLVSFIQEGLSLSFLDTLPLQKTGCVVGMFSHEVGRSELSTAHVYLYSYHRSDSDSRRFMRVEFVDSVQCESAVLEDLYRKLPFDRHDQESSALQVISDFSLDPRSGLLPVLRKKLTSEREREDVRRGQLLPS